MPACSGRPIPSRASVSDLAEACRVAGRWDLAISLAKQVLEQRIELLGPTHPDTRVAMHRLAMIYGGAGVIDESLALHEKVLALSEAAQNPDYSAMNSYARVLQAAGRLEEADACLRKTLERHRKLSDRRGREAGIAIVQRILGQNLLLQRRYPEAEEVARDALAYLEKEGQDENWALYYTKSLVGGALLGQAKYDEAEPFLVQGYEGMKQREARMDAGFKKLLTQAGNCLVSFYEVTNQPEKALAWREKLAAAIGDRIP